MQPRMDRQPRARPRRHRALAAGLSIVAALATAGCASNTPNQQASGSPTIVTAEQVITSCYHNYFYNGILPQSAAKSNCSVCVEQQLHKLGIQPTPGENETDLLTGVRLPSPDISSLQAACNVPDANSQ